jgi:hypothetical protein
VTPLDAGDRRFAGRSLRVGLGVVAAMAVCAFVVMSAVLLGGSSPDEQSAGTATPAASATPIATPPSAPVARQPVAMRRSAPTRLLVPAIGIDSNLMDLGLEPDGSLETPPGAFPAGWYTGAPTPGELGPAIIVGHVRYNEPGVFARLTDLRRADRIDVQREDGTTATFRVTHVAHFAKAAFPTRKVYGNIDHAGLRLITCGGLDASTNEYDENVVVFADLVPQ